MLAFAGNLVYLAVLAFAVVLVGAGLFLLAKVLLKKEGGGEALMAIALVLFGFALVYWGYSDITGPKLLAHIFSVWAEQILTTTIGG